MLHVYHMLVAERDLLRVNGSGLWDGIESNMGKKIHPVL